MRCLEKLPEDRFVSMDELLGALAGLGLYALPRAEMGGKHRRGADDDRKTRVSPGGTSYDSASRRGDDTEDIPGWQRDRLRRRARKTRSRHRYAIGGAIAGSGSRRCHRGRARAHTLRGRRAERGGAQP